MVSSLKLICVWGWWVKGETERQRERVAGEKERIHGAEKEEYEAKETKEEGRH